MLHTPWSRLARPRQLRLALLDLVLHRLASEPYSSQTWAEKAHRQISAVGWWYLVPMNSFRCLLGLMNSFRCHLFWWTAFAATRSDEQLLLPSRSDEQLSLPSRTMNSFRCLLGLMNCFRCHSLWWTAFAATADVLAPSDSGPHS